MLQRLFNFIFTLAGRVEGELTLNIPRDLRSLYAAPFSAEIAAKDPDSVKKLNDCCYEWIQSVEKVLKDITKDPEEEKKKGGKKDDLLKPADDGPKKAIRTKEIDNQGTNTYGNNILHTPLVKHYNDLLERR